MAYDCQECGACCAVFIVDLWPDDYQRLPADRRQDITMEGEPNGLQMRLVTSHPHGGGRCAALEGTLGVDCRCTVYEDRPRVCREFADGLHAMGECTRARKLAGLPLVEDAPC